MDTRTIPAIHDRQTTWQLIAGAVVALIKENAGQLGVPDIVSAVAQYAHFSDGPGTAQELFQLWLDDRLEDDKPFVVYARIPQRQQVMAPKRSRSLIVGGQEHPWPAMSIEVSGTHIRVNLLDDRVRSRYMLFCDLLTQRISGQAA